MHDIIADASALLLASFATSGDFSSPAIMTLGTRMSLLRAIRNANPQPLPRAFFARNPRRVARELLGKVLVRDAGNLHLAARIVEVEAYLGQNDPAAHASAGNTARTSVLFGPPGYRLRLFHLWQSLLPQRLLRARGKAGSVLFRALEPLVGIEAMAHARGITLQSPRDLPKLTSGPGRLAEAFGITRSSRQRLRSHFRQFRLVDWRRRLSRSRDSNHSPHRHQQSR